MFNSGEIDLLGVKLVKMIPFNPIEAYKYYYNYS